MTQADTAQPYQSTGWDEGAARAWVDKALRTEDVDFAWRLTAELVREDRPVVHRVLDAGAGPGGYLATVLDAFPDAEGVWFDMSQTMREEARHNLERFGDRVHYVIGDLVEIGQAGVPGTFDLITSSRASHHLALPDLTRFYQQCAGLLASDGWLANVDSISESDSWRQRVRAVRAKYRAAAGNGEVPTHPQINVAPDADQHRAALVAAGFSEVEVVWRVFVTALLMARKTNPQEFVRS